MVEIELTEKTITILEQLGETITLEEILREVIDANIDEDSRI